MFSREVLEAGKKLYLVFCKTQHVLRNLYSRVSEESVHASVTQITCELQKALEEFDTTWVNFEQLYVLELMVIEADARRFISEAIELEREMILIEVREKARGKNVVESEE